jgi:hypothetical protein
VRVEHLPGVAARAVAAVGEVVGRGLAEHHRPGRAEPRDLERVAPRGAGEEPRPLGARRRRRQAGHVVDRLGEHGNAVERPARPARPQAPVGRARLGGRGVGERVDGAPRGARRAAPVARAGGDLGGRPGAAPAAGLVLGHGAVERVAGAARGGPRRGRERDERGEAGEGFASGRGHGTGVGAGCGWCGGGRTIGGRAGQVNRPSPARPRR